MDCIEILFRGSQSEPYTIEIARHKDGDVEILCDCLAAQNGTHCKHRIALLTENYSDVIYTDTTKSNIETIKSWVSGTKLHDVLNHMLECEEQSEKWKKELKNAKRQLARVMECK